MEKYTEEIAELIVHRWNEISDDDETLQKLDVLWMKIMNDKSPPCCQQVRENFFHRIESFYQLKNPNFTKPISKKMAKQKEQTESVKFEMKEGLKFYVPSILGHVNSKNLTDDLAVECLSENPSRIKGFTKFPENWKALVGSYQKKKSKEESVPKSEDHPEATDKPVQDVPEVPEGN